MKLILGLLMLCVIVVAHELGHMLIAKACHIDVKEFWIGFGPKLLAFEAGNTKYVLRLIPFGGACVFENEEPDDAKTDNEEIDNARTGDVKTDDIKTDDAEPDDVKADAMEDVSSVKYDRKGRPLLHFNEASVWARTATLLAGPVFNFILAFLLGLVVVAFTYLPSAVVTDVTEGGAAYEAGMQAGDRIVKINSSNVYLYPEVSMGIQMGIGKPLSVVYEREGRKYKADMIPKLNEETGSYVIGVTFGGEEQINSRNAFTIIKDSFLYERFMVKMTFMSLKMLFSGQAGLGDLSGPVGVASVVSSEYDAAAKISPLAVVVSIFNIAVLISANLGIMNLLPFPALDGGRLLFCVYEIISGRKPDARVEGFIHFIGGMLLILLTAYVFFNDIFKLIGLK